MTHDALLTQFGYSVSESSLAQIDRVIQNTEGFEHIGKHLVTLHDHLQPHFSFVALSSNKDYFKIKNMATASEAQEEVNEIIYKWAEKFKVQLEKVSGKETFYILGFKK
ncbi:MAG: hypothetical protein IBX45_06385 [Campylobacterales bacterium]|nr:hypothetical protein [Campylobacterales bacterium]